MEWVKTTAKTLPEAIDLALDNLGVDEAEAEIVVIEEPRQGLFGRTRGTARVEARVKPKPAPPKQDRNRNKRNRSDGGGRNKNGRNKNRSKNRGGGGNDKNRNSGGGNGGSANGGGKGRGGQRDERAKSGGGRDANRDAGGSDKSNDRNNDRNNDRSSGGGNNRSADRESRPRRSKARANGNDQNMKPKEESPVEDVAEHLETFLEGLTEAFGLDGGVRIDNSEADVLVGQVVGQHGLLVGPKGRTLDAIQELARISCQRAVPSSVRIKVDVGGYREKRVAALGEFARKAAEAAVADQVEVALEPMSPADRKAVHDAISEDHRVETRSVGSEPRRKVLVIPVADATPAADDHSNDDVADEVSEDVAADQATGDGSEEE